MKLGGTWPHGLTPAFGREEKLQQIDCTLSSFFDSFHSQSLPCLAISMSSRSSLLGEKFALPRRAK